MKKGTIWTDPNFDTFTQEQNQANDQRKIIATDDLQQDVEPEVLYKEVNCDEAASDSESNISIDSDYDENFDVDIETTRNRQERKKVRHHNRGEDKLLLSRKSRRKIGQFPKVCSLGW